mmetsp:Transcript_25877/g.74169  ORF Transcript_25877/g.74169 Transcript_25877/m.74169 type:complete len:526 (-) Transcript_25877:239-1816(-)
MRLRTPTRVGSPPEEVAGPEDTCPLGAVCTVVQDVLSLKYGTQLDEADFLGKARVRCDPGARLLPERLVDALNEEPALRVKDVGNERLLQLQLRATPVSTFGELVGLVRRWPGTACAVASVGVGGRKAQLVSPCREAYGNAGALVARTWMKSTGRLGPLHTFSEDSFNGAVLLDPVIVRVLKYESEPNRMLDLHIPPVSTEYDCAHKNQASEVALATSVCSLLADMVPRPGGGDAAARGCALVADFMARHAGEAALQAAACHALRTLAAGCGAAGLLGEAQLAVETVIAAMRRHSAEPDVQEAACAVLAGVTACCAELQSITFTNGGLEQVVGSMRQFPDEVELQTWACGALASLAANHPMNQSAMTGSRAIDSVVAAMERHPSNAQLQTMACGALGNMAANNQNNQAAIAATGGLQLIVAAMREHLESVPVQLSAIGALWCLAKGNPEGQAAVARVGGAELTVSALERHNGDCSLRAMASGALQIFVPGLEGAMGAASARSTGTRGGQDTSRARSRVPLMQEAR